MRASSRPVLWGLLFAAIALGGIDARVVRLLLAPRENLAQPDCFTPEYLPFLREVAARTRPGETILLIAPVYEYPFYRASYFLADRRVIPYLDAGGHPHPERLRGAATIAVWQMPAPDGAFDTVWSGHEGLLLRRKR